MKTEQQIKKGNEKHDDNGGGDLRESFEHPHIAPDRDLAEGQQVTKKRESVHHVTKGERSAKLRGALLLADSLVT